MIILICGDFGAGVQVADTLIASISCINVYELIVKEFCNNRNLKI